MSEFYLIVQELPQTEPQMSLYAMGGMDGTTKAISCPVEATERAKEEAIRSGRKVLILRAVAAWEPEFTAKYSEI